MEIKEIRLAVIDGKVLSIAEMVRGALDAGHSPENILSEGLLSGLREVAGKLSGEDADIPGVLISAKCVRIGTEILRPALNNTYPAPLGSVIIGTVSGDLHDIGKNLVSMMFRGEGFEVIDLGVDVSKKQFVDAARAHPEAEIIAVSCLLTTCMAEMRDTVAALRKLRRKTPMFLMVGGAPVTEKFAREIGADAFTDNAWDAARLAKEHVLGKVGRT